MKHLLSENMEHLPRSQSFGGIILKGKDNKFSTNEFEIEHFLRVVLNM